MWMYECGGKLVWGHIAALFMPSLFSYIFSGKLSHENVVKAFSIKLSVKSLNFYFFSL